MQTVHSINFCTLLLSIQWCNVVVVGCYSLETHQVVPFIRLSKNMNFGLSHIVMHPLCDNKSIFIFSGYGTYIHLRECKLRGYRVLQLSDRFQLNGKDYLSLDSDTDSWTALMPEAQDLKQSWMLKADYVSLEKIHLKEECEEFIKQMIDTQNQEGEDL